MRKPYFRRDRGEWYIKTADGKSQIRLHKNQEEAYRIWREMLAVQSPDSPSSNVTAIAANYLKAAKRLLSPEHYQRTARYLADFCNEHGAVNAAAIGGLVYAEAVNSGRSSELANVNDMIAVLRRTGRCEHGNVCDYPLVDPRSLAKEYEPVTPTVPPTPGIPPVVPGFDSVIVYAGGKAWKASAASFEPVT
jgi:hypothetical protein